jgi:hypothetical protein
MQFPTGKVNKGRNGHPNDQQFAEIIAWLVADLIAADELRREELRRCGALREEIYRNAREAGLPPAVLRALALCHRSRGSGGNGHTT